MSNKRKIKKVGEEIGIGVSRSETNLLEHMGKVHEH